jgi:hypothetical protein
MVRLRVAHRLPEPSRVSTAQLGLKIASSPRRRRPTLTAPPDYDPRPAEDRLLAERPAPAPRAPEDRVLAEEPAAFPGTGAQGRRTPGHMPKKRRARKTLTGR